MVLLKSIGSPFAIYRISAIKIQSHLFSKALLFSFLPSLPPISLLCNPNSILHNLKKKKIVALIIGTALYKGVTRFQGFRFRELNLQMIKTEEIKVFLQTGVKVSSIHYVAVYKTIYVIH